MTQSRPGEIVFYDWLRRVTCVRSFPVMGWSGLQLSSAILFTNEQRNETLKSSKNLKKFRKWSTKSDISRMMNLLSYMNTIKHWKWRFWITITILKAIVTLLWNDWADFEPVHNEVRYLGPPRYLPLPRKLCPGFTWKLSWLLPPGYSNPP